MTSPELPPDLRQALDAAAQEPRLLIASDFDGTISPIVANPADARPVAGASDCLAELAALPNTTVALISGRALRNLGELSSAPTGVQLVGSHGAEFSADFLESIDEAAKSLLPKLIDTMRTVAGKYPGAGVETKPVSVAFHVRNVAADQAQAALDEALASVAGLDLHITEGKAVREFAVIDTDKGAAIDLLRRQAKADATVYFGDDVTDEKAFTRLDQESGRDVGVKVGDGESKAQFRVESPDAVFAALRYLYTIRS